MPGELKWKFETGREVKSSPAVAGNYVYIGSDDRYVYCLDKDAGGLKWKFITGNLVFSSPAVSGNCVYVGSTDNYVYAFATLKSTGTPKELAEKKKKLANYKKRLKLLEKDGYGEDEEFKELKRLIDEEERKLQNETNKY